ncbi:magnesium transporter [Tahibacter amnicola]|uniref:Magnesium transporter n=1 Tax=Tahibacter amnicola TaxID=2976241 RepID=A0ABY6BAJ6_9GAMM|nr:magnesium transporter [Tahibacter amnicola]UXI66699.1 magnesium transporter [Tahibacter amnicola]
MDPLSKHLRELDPKGAADALAHRDDAEVAAVLAELNPGQAVEILEEFAPSRRDRIVAANAAGEQWLEDRAWPENTVGRLMERPNAVFLAGTRIREAVESLREAVKKTLITYLYVVDADDRLVGVVAFRELLYANADDTLADVMVPTPFFLHPETDLIDAMHDVVTRHYPVYPVCDDANRLIGVVRGSVLFEQQTFEISAQAGSMVGVEKEERTATPWLRALKFRHPWLQLNLFTAFVAAGVVGAFQDTINRIVLLAVFIPVLSGQCSNTGCQALAVTLRGMTLGEVRAGQAFALMGKEAILGFANGALTGLLAAAGMYAMAVAQQHGNPLALAVITFLAMTCSCAISGVAGACVPLALKRLGADPATASSIFLTTATDVVSMSLFLGLAAWWIV